MDSTNEIAGSTLRYIKARGADSVQGNLRGYRTSAQGIAMIQQHNGQRPTVLVVEDDAAVRSSLKFSLEVEGFAVRDFCTGHELLGMIDLPGSNCVVVDYNLPDMTGLEVLGGLRDRRVSVPAILITSAPNQNLRDRAAAVGAGIVEKPLLGDALLQSIREIVAR